MTNTKGSKIQKFKKNISNLEKRLTRRPIIDLICFLIIISLSVKISDKLYLVSSSRLFKCLGPRVKPIIYYILGLANSCHTRIRCNTATGQPPTGGNGYMYILVSAFRYENTKALALRFASTGPCRRASAAARS